MPTRTGDVIIEERDDTTIWWVTIVHDDGAQVGDLPEAIADLQLAIDQASRLRAPGEGFQSRR
jgi:hypothetical protein